MSKAQTPTKKRTVNSHVPTGLATVATRSNVRSYQKPELPAPIGEVQTVVKKEHERQVSIPRRGTDEFEQFDENTPRNNIEKMMKNLESNENVVNHNDIKMELEDGGARSQIEDSNNLFYNLSKPTEPIR